jgi:hypothetical protein
MSGSLDKPHKTKLILPVGGWSEMQVPQEMRTPALLSSQ